MNRISRTISLALLMACACEEVAQASLLTSAGVNSSFTSNFPGCSETGTSLASAACSGNGFSASAWALADYGTMKVFSAAERTSTSAIGFQTGAFAMATDTFVVLNADLGEKFQLEFEIYGDILPPVSGDCGGAGCESRADFSVNAAIHRGTSCQANFFQSLSESAPYRCVLERAIDGDAFFTAIELRSSIELRSITAGLVDFSRSLVVTRAVVLLPNGEIDPDAVIVAESGYRLP
ncbi:MAG: hypothetical protein QM757_06360 [Paludibaculum sp.]